MCYKRREAEWHSPGSCSPPLTCLLSPLSIVDHSMFENLNTTLTPKLQSSRSFPHLSRSAAPSSVTPGSAEAGGPGLRVGSSQHLKNLGKAMGAKVNDLLRRKESSSLGSVGVMEINKTVGAQLPGGEDAACEAWLEDER